MDVTLQTDNLQQPGQSAIMKQYMRDYYGHTSPGLTALSRKRGKCHFTIKPDGAGVAVSVWAKNYIDLSQGLSFLQNLDKRHPRLAKKYTGSHGVRSRKELRRREVRGQQCFNFGASISPNQMTL